MLAYMLIVAIAYGVAYGITSTGINLWRAILGFALAFLSRGLAAVYWRYF